MIRVWQLAMAALLATLMGAPAEASSRDAVFSACATEMKQQFGATEFTFSKFRRDENRNHAFGEMTLSNGKKQRIRCTFQRGRVRGVSFRNSNSSRLEGRFWNTERPEGAIYVEPKPDSDEQPIGTEATGPEAVTPDETTQTAAVPPEAETEDAPTPPATAKPDQQASDDAPADDSPATTADPEEEARPRPVFRRVN